MTSGNIPKHPISLLNSSMMRAFILSAGDRYDCIIIDAPPVVGLADLNILGKLADFELNLSPMPITFAQLLNVVYQQDLVSQLDF
jgi:Mrp family chromosome partitioning ATPase